MLKEIFKDLCFKPLNDYVDKIESKIKIIDVNKTDAFTFVDCKLENKLKLEIIVLNDEEKINICFNYKSNITLEKIEFMILKNQSYNDINRTIRHDYWLLEDNTITTYNSFYTYLNNECKKGKENTRKVKIEDIRKNIFDDNLSYLYFHIDDSNISTIQKEEKDSIEPNLETVILDYKKYNIDEINEFLKTDNKIKVK